MTRDIEKKIKQALDTIRLPYTTCNLVQALTEIKEDENKIELKFKFGFPALALQDQIQEEVIRLIKMISGKTVTVDMESAITAHKVQPGIKGMDNIKNIIAIASGKGGVGKSTVAVNLALALQRAGARVGLLDADIYGPSQPLMLGLQGEHPKQLDKQRLMPITVHDLQVMSIGFLMTQSDAPMIWRGPIVSTTLQQLLQDTQWEDLDYLIIDLPPGTGDIQLTMAQKIPVSGAIIVTTPQDVALADARRAYRMFEKVNIPTLGVIENMSAYKCSQCGHVDHIFGEGGAAKFTKEYGLEMLGSLPLATQIREQSDSGTPIVVADPKGAIAQLYNNISMQAAIKLALQSQDIMRKFPRIVIEKNE
jgi:ATP-binding protein involved in chromosome partitioning